MADQADDLGGSPIELFDVVRSTVPLADLDHRNVLHHIPVGTEGTVVEVYGGGKAFEVDFDLYNDPRDPLYFVTVTTTVNAGQCELVWKCPRKGDEKRDAG